MTVIVDIDGLTGVTEYIQEGELEKLDLPAFITWRSSFNYEDQFITEAESKLK